MKRLGSEASEGGEWTVYDERTEQLVQLRSDAENPALSSEERVDAFERASWLRPTQGEWEQARQIGDTRWTIRHERRLAKQQRSMRPRPPTSRPTAPVLEDDGDEPVTSERGQALMGIVHRLFVTGGTFPRISPAPPAWQCRTDPRYRDQYWYQVELERKRRAWMLKRGLEYYPRLAIHLCDLGPVEDAPPVREAPQLPPPDEDTW